MRKNVRSQHHLLWLRLRLCRLDCITAWLAKFLWVATGYRRPCSQKVSLGRSLATSEAGARFTDIVVRFIMTHVIRSSYDKS